MSWRVRRWTILSAAAMALTGGLVVATLITGEKPGAQGYRGNLAVVASPLPEFALRDQVGRLVRSTELRGKVTLLTFLDTKCTAACPIIASQVARTLPLLTHDERAQIAVVAISVAPKVDTPANVHAFLRRNHAEGALRYLTGREAQLRPLWKAFQILSAAESGEDDTHSAPVRIYNRGGRWIATQHVGADLSPDNLAHDLRLALAANEKEDSGD